MSRDVQGLLYMCMRLQVSLYKDQYRTLSTQHRVHSEVCEQLGNRVNAFT